MLSKPEFDAIHTGDYDAYAQASTVRVDAHMAAVHCKARRQACMQAAMLAVLLLCSVAGSAAIMHNSYGFSWRDAFVLLASPNDIFALARK